jgi:hypothetical protein
LLITAALQKATSALDKAEKDVQRLLNQQSSESGTNKLAPEDRDSGATSTATAVPEDVETTAVATVGNAAIGVEAEVPTTATVVAPVNDAPIDVDVETQKTTATVTPVEDAPIAVNDTTVAAGTAASDNQQIRTPNENGEGSGKRKRKRTQAAEDDSDPEPVGAATDLEELASKFLRFFRG